MRRIKIYLGLPYASATSIFMSGMLNMAMDIYKEKGEVTKLDYIQICTNYNYGLNDDFEKYWFNVQSLFKQYKEIHGIK